MATLAISGNKLAGHFENPKIVVKQNRMKLVMLNGIMLICLAIFLFYRANFQTIDNVFLYVQIVELTLGFANLVLICLNIKSGLQLSGKLKLDKFPA